eukprot:Blabericola_migrator_1__260@NODE_1069_length_5537_cov_108_299452_g79_i1_p7_GENE_NODE_1069_length_5537_cov_108_299452_g79_i1NODE_1069_length_5537_cov_108_299452_g79_i1_p7_ORF_typecomplete_len107_score9_54_NODE_1069_length_5537_cov_108_299452_g79_i150885408
MKTILKIIWIHYLGSRKTYCRTQAETETILLGAQLQNLLGSLTSSTGVLSQLSSTVANASVVQVPTIDPSDMANARNIADAVTGREEQMVNEAQRWILQSCFPGRR